MIARSTIPQQPIIEINNRISTLSELSELTKSPNKNYDQIRGELLTIDEDTGRMTRQNFVAWKDVAYALSKFKEGSTIRWSGTEEEKYITRWNNKPDVVVNTIIREFAIMSDEWLCISKRSKDGYCAKVYNRPTKTWDCLYCKVGHEMTVTPIVHTFTYSRL